MENLCHKIASYVDKILTGTQARKINALKEDWRFHAGDVQQAFDPGFDDTTWRMLDVPHDYSVEAEFSEKNEANAYVQSGIVWYRKHFDIAEKINNQKFSLLFDGVSMNSQVWINGRFLGQRPYGFTPFWYDITPFIKTGENIIAVKVDCSIQPFARSYTGTGIFRSVWLISAYPLHIEQWGVAAEVKKLGPEEAEIVISTKAKVDRYPETLWNAFCWQGDGMEHNNFIEKRCCLKTSILDREGKVVGESENAYVLPQFSKHEFKQTVSIPNPTAWSLENPYMYSIHSKLLIDGETVDDTLTPLGIRTLSFDADRGFSLNGESLKIKGVCLHQDSGVFGGAVPVKAWVEKLLVLKKAGCNAIRTAHHPFPAEFYHICDALGFMVMDEAFDEWQMGWDRGFSDQPFGKNAYGYYLYFEQWHETDLRAMIRRDRNHPSVIIWSVGNEIPELYFDEGVAVLKRLVEICKEEDSTRPVTVCAEGNHLLRIHEGMMGQVDIPGYNYINSREGKAMYGRIHNEHPEWVLIGSETEYEPEHWKTILDNSYVIGQFLWVGYDYLGEGADIFGEDANLGFTFDLSALAGNKDSQGERTVRHGWAFGLVDITDTPKGEYFFRKSIWSHDPFVQPAVRQEVAESKKSYSYFKADLHWNWCEGEKKTVYGFTNCDKAELFLNGKSLGAKDKNPIYALEWEVDYAPGTLLAVGYINGVEVSRQALVTAGPAAAIKLDYDGGALKSGREDYAGIAISIVDANGVVVPDASNRVSVKVDGCASLLGAFSGDMTSNESYRSRSCQAYKGRCKAVVVPAREAGPIDIVVESEGLAPAGLKLTVE